MTASVNRTYVPEIDQIRAFAAVLVILYHGFQLIGAQLAHGTNFNSSRHWIYAHNPIIAVIEEGHSGVGCFIVLSGFVLSLGAIGNAINYRPFIVARVLRIYPMLLVCLVGAISVRPTTLSSIVISILPLNISGGVSGNLTGMFWAVAVEFQCYLIFPFLIMFSNEKGSRFLIQVILVAVIISLLAVYAEGANPHDISYWTVFGRVDQFCIGIIAARLYVERSWAKLNPWWFLLAAVVCVIALYLYNGMGGWVVVSKWKIGWPPVEGAMWASFIVTYLSAGRHLPYAIAGLTSKLGEISYSLYLLHFTVIFLVINRHMWVRLTGNGYDDALLTTALVVLPISIALAILTYHTVELPFLRLRPKYISPLGETATETETTAAARSTLAPLSKRKTAP